MNSTKSPSISWLHLLMANLLFTPLTFYEIDFYAYSSPLQHYVHCLLCCIYCSSPEFTTNVEKIQGVNTYTHEYMQCDYYLHYAVASSSCSTKFVKSIDLDDGFSQKQTNKQTKKSSIRFHHQLLRSKQNNSMSQFLNAAKFSGCVTREITPAGASSYLDTSDSRKHHFALQHSDLRLRLTCYFLLNDPLHARVRLFLEKVLFKHKPLATPVLFTNDRDDPHYHRNPR